jgi:hypothetical protein
MEALSRSFPDYLETLKDKNVVSSLALCVHGYRYTGKSIEIRGTVYPVRDPAGSYCYVLFHKGEVNTWESLLSGEGITRDPHVPDQYVAEVQANGETAVSADIEPKQPGLRGICATFKIAHSGALGGGMVAVGIVAYWPRRRKRDN